MWTDIKKRKEEEEKWNIIMENMKENLKMEIGKDLEYINIIIMKNIWVCGKII